jgi:Lrp/AsnC family transcriptional regulator, leucine-responsive regulatory protein
MRLKEFDQLDRAILTHLQRDARTVAGVIADDVGLSAAAVQRRIKRLRDVGIIARDVAVVDPGAVGLAMTFLVSVQLEREHADVLDTFRRRTRADASVQQCYYVTGDADFVLVVLARSMEDFDAFTRRTLFDPDVRRFTTNVVMSRVKVGLTVPLDAPPAESS